MIVGYYIYYLHGWNGYLISGTCLVLMLAYSYAVSFLKLFRIQRFRLHESDNYEKLPRKKGLLFFFTLAAYGSRDRSDITFIISVYPT